MRVFVPDYLKFILTPFFRAWWVLITGTASLFAFFATPIGGWKLQPVGALVLTVLAFSLSFLSLSVILQGWTLYKDQYSGLRLLGLHFLDTPSVEVMFVFGCRCPLEIGSVVQVNRRMNDVDVPFALVHVDERNAQGDFQGTPISIVPNHLRDFRMSKFSKEEMVASPSVRVRQLLGALEDIQY